MPLQGFHAKKTMGSGRLVELMWRDAVTLPLKVPGNHLRLQPGPEAGTEQFVLEFEKIPFDVQLDFQLVQRSGRDAEEEVGLQ
jgi:hypothetical protein